MGDFTFAYDFRAQMTLFRVQILAQCLYLTPQTGEDNSCDIRRIAPRTQQGSRTFSVLVTTLHSCWTVEWTCVFVVSTQQPFTFLLKMSPQCERVAPSLLLVHVAQMELTSTPGPRSWNSLR